MPLPGRNPEIMSFKVKSRRLPPALADGLRRLLNRLLGFTAFNRVYAEMPPCSPMTVSAAFLDQIGIKVELDGEPLASVPREGPLLFVANHPHGLVDGFALDALLTPTRPEGMLMGIYVLGEVPELGVRLIPVDPQRRRSKRTQNLSGWRRATKQVAGGGALVVFPAGGVSRFDWRHRAVRDTEWSPHIAALARRAQATIVPLFIYGRNRLFYQVMGMISPGLQQLFLFGEYPRMAGRTLRITVGKAIPPERWAHLADDGAAIAYIRAESEKLAG